MKSQDLPLKCAGMALKAMTKLFWAGSISVSRSVCFIWTKGSCARASSCVDASERFKTRWNTSDAATLSGFVWVQFLLLVCFFKLMYTYAPHFLITDFSFCFSSSGTISRRQAMSLSVVPCSRRCGRTPPCCPCMRARSWARWKGWTKIHFVADKPSLPNQKLKLSLKKQEQETLCN